MLGSTIEQLKAESDGHDRCGIRAIEEAGTSNSTKQLRRYLEELLSNATPPQAKLASLSTERDVRLLNNMSASCLMLRRLHMK